MVGQNHSQAVPNFLLWELSQGNLGVLQQRNPGNAAGIGHSKAQRASRTTQPRHWAVPRKHIAEGPRGAAGRGEQGKGRPSWRALLRQRRLSPRASAALSSKSIGPSNEKKSDDTEVVPPVLSRTRRGSAYRKPGGRCSVGAHFSRAPAWLCRTDGGGAAPSESRTTRRSSLQFCYERGASAPIEIPWRAMLRRRPLLPRASAALSVIWGRGCAPQKSDDTEVVPPVLLRTRRVSAQRNPLEGDAPSAPIFPARQRGFIGGMGAGPRPAKIGRHGGPPSKATAASGLPALRLRLQARQPFGSFFLHPSGFLLTSGRLISRTAGQTEAEEVVAVARVVVVAAVGDSAVVRNAVPAAAADATVGGIYNILAPLPHIPTHVVNT